MLVYVSKGKVIAIVQKSIYALIKMREESGHHFAWCLLLVSACPMFYGVEDVSSTKLPKYMHIFLFSH